MGLSKTTLPFTNGLAELISSHNMVLEFMAHLLVLFIWGVGWSLSVGRGMTSSSLSSSRSKRITSHWALAPVVEPYSLWDSQQQGCKHSKDMETLGVFEQSLYGAIANISCLLSFLLVFLPLNWILWCTQFSAQCFKTLKVVGRKLRWHIETTQRDNNARTWGDR